MRLRGFPVIAFAALGFWLVMILASRSCDGADPRLAGQIEAVCPAGERCYFECEPGRCHQTCRTGSQCKASCAGGGCRQTCQPGADCHLICGGAGCLQECVDGSDCRTTCDPRQGCKVRCPGGDRTDGLGCMLPGAGSPAQRGGRRHRP